MPRIFELARKHVIATYDNDAIPGCVIGTRSRSFQRERFSASVIDELLGDDKDDDNGRLLYIGRDWQTVGIVKDWCDRLGLPKKFREQTLRANSSIPSPKMLNYTTVQQFMRLGERLPAKAIDLLVVDERRAADFTRAIPLIQRLSPEFTCVLTTQVKSTAWSFVAPLHQIRGSRDT